MPHTIELDCAPGNPRPGDLLTGVLKDTDITLGETCSRVFGNWVWDVPEDQTEKYETVRDLVKERITKLYHRGLIRYGSW